MTWCNIKLPCLFVRSVTLSDAVYFSIFSMKDNVHPSPSFNCCSWGSLSGLESLWIWHRKPGLSRVLFLLPPRLLPFALCNSAVIRAKRSGFWSLPCGHCNNPKSMEWGRRKRLYCSINRFSMANIKWMLWPQLDPTSIFCNINHSKPQKTAELWIFQFHQFFYSTKLIIIEPECPSIFFRFWIKISFYQSSL